CEFLIDFDDSAKFDIQFVLAFMRQGEVYRIRPVDTEFLVYTDIEDFAGGNVPWNEVAVIRIFFLEEVPRFAVFICPDTSTFTTCRFTHQSEFIITRYCCRMDLDELTIGIHST